MSRSVSQLDAVEINTLLLARYGIDIRLGYSLVRRIDQLTDTVRRRVTGSGGATVGMQISMQVRELLDA